MQMPAWAKDCLTGPDGKTYDAARFAFVGAVLAFLGFTGFDLLVNHASFNQVTFGEGFAALTGGSGVGIAVKQLAGAEPPHQKDPI